VKVAPVLTVTNPVMELALVAVKSASIKEMPSRVIRGIRSKQVPIIIRIKKEYISIIGGLILILDRKPVPFKMSMPETIKK
jgi:hypothetical protein